MNRKEREMTTPLQKAIEALPFHCCEGRLSRERVLEIIRQYESQQAVDVPSWFAKSVAMADAQKVCDLTNEVAALQKFKNYVHKRLDDAGVPTHPDGEHSKHGCRIGDRLDIALRTEQPKVDEWQPIETAPKDGTRFLAFIDNDSLPLHLQFHAAPPLDIAYWTEFNGGGWVKNKHGTISHWMPLPMPPAALSADKEA